MNEYIQEILEKYEHMDTDMMSLYYAEEAMRKMYKRGIEDSLKCVPEEKFIKDYSHSPRFSYKDVTMPNHMGWNECRKETIDNIKRLLDNK